MKADRNLSHIDCGLWKGKGGNTLSLTAFWKHYGFSLEIADLDAEPDSEGMPPVIFKKFLRTDDRDYAVNYLRKCAQNNFGATPWD